MCIPGPHKALQKPHTPYRQHAVIAKVDAQIAFIAEHAGRRQPARYPKLACHLSTVEGLVPYLPIVTQPSQHAMSRPRAYFLRDKICLAIQVKQYERPHVQSAYVSSLVTLRVCCPIVAGFETVCAGLSVGTPLRPHRMLLQRRGLYFVLHLAASRPAPHWASFLLGLGLAVVSRGFLVQLARNMGQATMPAWEVDTGRSCVALAARRAKGRLLPCFRPSRRCDYAHTVVAVMLPGFPSKRYRLVGMVRHEVIYAMGRLELVREHALGREDAQQHHSAMLQLLQPAKPLPPMPHSTRRDTVHWRLPLRGGVGVMQPEVAHSGHRWPRNVRSTVDD
jgi:hypothetical protein